MRYILIDRIVRLEASRSIRAIKNVTLSEDVYNEHFLGFPVMPGALQIEVLAQAATALIEVSANFKKKAFLIMVTHAKFRSLVKPGDQLVIDVEMLSDDGDVVQVKGTIKLGDDLVMNAKLVLALKEASIFYPSKTKHLVESLYDVLLRDAELINVQTS